MTCIDTALATLSPTTLRSSALFPPEQCDNRDKSYIARAQAIAAGRTIAFAAVQH